MSVSRVLRVAAVAVAAVLAPSSVVGWGVLGHYMTAAIAQNYLSTAATNGVTNLLPESNGDMGTVASWADQVGRDEFTWSPALHFINTPDWACTYERARDCVDDGVQNYCVDGAIQNFTNQLVTQNAPLSMNVALKFVIHFIGDIHQPLHVGFTGDEGGNTEYGTFEETSDRRLHQVWDEDIIEKRLNDDFNGDNSTYLADFLSRLSSGDFAANVTEWQSCPTDEPTNIAACSESWASESVVYACDYAYVDQDGNKIEDGFDLEDPYYDFSYPIADIQLAKGGIRLANVLNKIFASEAMREYTVPRPVFLQNQRIKAAKAKAAHKAFIEARKARLARKHITEV